MRRQRSVRVATVGSLVALLLLVSSVAAASTANVKIGETNNRYHFSPVTTFVNVGGKVTWTNGSDASHTVTSDSGGELASATIGPGATFGHTFSSTGAFAYHCTIHTYMVGKVTVLAAGVALPATDALSTSQSSDGNQGIAAVVLVLFGIAGGALAFRRSRRSA
ncbi:MAG TPA: plastocyanin/azurin family copper-binding protein [Candidatus Bathyarchaeia archaeon]|nr:plastocyanin/azurin family copper-binding protein [Candidatus Bathyarchaeia archaeon]